MTIRTERIGSQLIDGEWKDVFNAQFVPRSDPAGRHWHFVPDPKLEGTYALFYSREDARQAARTARQNG